MPEGFHFTQVDACGDGHAYCGGVWFRFCAAAILVVAIGVVVLLRQDVFDHFGTTPAFIDVPCNFLDLRTRQAEVLLVWMRVGGFVDDGTEE